MLNTAATEQASQHDLSMKAYGPDIDQLKPQTPDVNMDKPTKKASNLKHSYTIPCSSQFRDRVAILAESKKVNVADLARSVLLMVSATDISDFPDPGDPDPKDRETIILKSGPSKGRPWRRKPRLQVRIAPGYDALHIRKALNLALHMDDDKAAIRVETEESLKARERELSSLKQAAEEARKESEKNKFLPETIDELERLKAMVAVLSFEPLRQGVQDRSDALHILGFPPKTYPDRMEVRSRFRMLATIHHPDGKYGSHERMSQLNQAMQILR